MRVLRITVIDYPEHQAALMRLRDRLGNWMQMTSDRRATAGGSYQAFDLYPYFGDAKPMPTAPVPKR